MEVVLVPSVVATLAWIRWCVVVPLIVSSCERPLYSARLQPRECHELSSAMEGHDERQHRQCLSTVACLVQQLVVPYHWTRWAPCPAPLYAVLASTFASVWEWVLIADVRGHRAEDPDTATM